MNNDLVIGIVGLGYVGLQLAVAFGEKYRTIGYDKSKKKTANFIKNIDSNGEVVAEQFERATMLSFAHTIDDLKEANVFIIAVPTPVDVAQKPDFRHLIEASRAVGGVITKGSVVIFESTVYPGATQEICLPELERVSGLLSPKDFQIAYSPERINPGDKNHNLKNIVKIVAADEAATLDIIGTLYEAVVDVGVYRVQSIKVAEAAKVIENIQRDINIALMNEFSVIFNLIGIDTHEVIKAAQTKWNFMRFEPGLVGGHCIGVDPYYLTHKAKICGYHPEIILSGRRINDGMAAYVAKQTIKQMVRANMSISDATVSLLGLTFKEDCADLRNSKSYDLFKELVEYGCTIRLHDPLADANEISKVYGSQPSNWKNLGCADVVIVAVPHKTYLSVSGEEWQTKVAKGGVFIDLKSAVKPGISPEHEALFWQL